jgi:adenine-specific DNA-methyltransferase
MEKLAATRRLQPSGSTLQYVLFLDDYSQSRLTALWGDVGGASDKIYTVQTSATVVRRCLLSSTDPGDLVLDPTCGSGTTAHVAEQWGRRWITIDTSRVPLALGRQRLLTATFDWYQLRDDIRGPAGGFVYKRKQNARGLEVGGIVPHLTLRSITNDEPAQEEVLVDRPEIQKKIVRVAGPFTLEATIPTPVDLDSAGNNESGAAPDHNDWVERVINILRRSPTLYLGANRSIELTQLRPPARTLALSAEAMVNGMPLAIVIGPEHGSVSEKQVSEAGKEANVKSYSQLLVIGLAIEPNARKLVEEGEAVMGIPSVYVQATPDLLMGDLLKTMRSSQIFSVCGLPDIDVIAVNQKEKSDAPKWQVALRGLDVFDPVTMKAEAHPGDDVPCWMLDQDYDSMVFHGTQVFFPRTQAWNALQRALKTDFDPSVWEHLSGTTSTPFSAPAGKDSFTIAVKVIDPRGNELLVTRDVRA